MGAEKILGLGSPHTGNYERISTPKGIAIARQYAKDRATLSALPEAVQGELERLKKGKDPNYHAIRALVLGKEFREEGILEEPLSSVADESYGTIHTRAAGRLLDKLRHGGEEKEGDEPRDRSALLDRLYAAFEVISIPPPDAEESRKTTYRKYVPILKLLYGFPRAPGEAPGEEKNLKETGKIVGLSRERVRQIETEAIYALRMVMLTYEERRELREQRGRTTQQEAQKEVLGELEQTIASASSCEPSQPGNERKTEDAHEEDQNLPTEDLPLLPFGRRVREILRRVRVYFRFRE